MTVVESKIGDKVKFADPNAGYDSDISFAKKAGLVVGKTYILSDIVVHDCHTELCLQGLSGSFNSVQFEVGE